MRFTDFKWRGWRNGLLRPFYLTLLVLSLSAGGAAAEEEIKFKTKLSPGVLTGHGDWTGSLEYDLGVSVQLWTLPTGDEFRKNLSARATTRGVLAIDPDLNTTPLVTDLGVSTSINLYRPSKVEPGAEPGTYRTLQQGFNCGLVSLSLLGGYEADQRFENRNVTFGAELGYVLTENRGLKALVPSVFIGYDFVLVDDSELPQQVGVNEDDHQRLRIFSSWKLPVGGWVHPRLDPLNAHFDVRYYLSDGLPRAVRAADRDDALYLAGAFSYSFGTEPLWGIVNAAYVKVADGRIPPATDDATTVTVGLTVWER